MQKTLSKRPTSPSPHMPGRTACSIIEVSGFFARSGVSYEILEHNAEHRPQCNVRSVQAERPHSSVAERDALAPISQTRVEAATSNVVASDRVQSRMPAPSPNVPSRAAFAATTSRCTPKRPVFHEKIVIMESENSRLRTSSPSSDLSQNWAFRRCEVALQSGGARCVP